MTIDEKKDGYCTMQILSIAIFKKIIKCEECPYYKQCEKEGGKNEIN